MNQPSAPNYLHLDFKGPIPALDRLLEWIDFFADCGFDGIVFEYEDRLPWRAWPGTFRPGYPLADWVRVWQRCEQRGLDVVPLIQTLGHLECFLKHPRHAHLRENDCWNEWCPTHPAVEPILESWIAEVFDTHPPLRYVHIGCDEAWNLASCPRCQAEAATHAMGDMALFIRHVRRVCAWVSARGARPMIWGDLLRKEHHALAAELPEDVILVDWKYFGVGPWDTTDRLRRSGREIWGASAVRTLSHSSQVLSMPGQHLANVRGWHAQVRTKRVSGLLHTTWGRNNGLYPPFGPWEDSVPVFRAAGRIGGETGDPLVDWIPRIDAVLAEPMPQPALDTANALTALITKDRWTDACRRWWELALQFRHLHQMTLRLTFLHEQLEVLAGTVGVCPDAVNRSRTLKRETRDGLQAWSDRVMAYFRDGGWDGAAEFAATRTQPLLRMLEWPDWAAATIPDQPPVSRH